jgi:outer membrane receptor protein involved in Fe transport
MKSRRFRHALARVQFMAIGAIGVISGLLPARGAAAQQTGTIEGSVVTVETAVVLAGVRVSVAGTGLGAFTDEKGAFRIERVPAGTVELVTDYLGRRGAKRTVEVRAGSVVRVDFRLDVEAVPAGELVVSVSREAERRAETPATVGVVTAEDIRSVMPAHPSQIMSRIAGVWVNVTGGEGHMTAIRQPITTNPVYLYLEDGVPTRSTGFFNHNALYEIDVPQAERIEVVKGPATALYGSDAIGGSVNVVTRAPRAGSGISLEGGAWGFGRLLASAGAVRGSNGWLGELNVTRTDGWRKGTAYDRESGTVRWDHALAGGSRISTVVTYSRIDQNTAGSSAISRDDYLNRPTANYTPISYRRIEAFRLHSSFERVGERSLLTFTPFVRWNQMDILPNWTLTFDPGIWVTGHKSVGALFKYRRDVEPMRARIIAGADLDYSPGSHFEKQILPQRNGVIFQSYTDGQPVYDYGVKFLAASPYLQAEASPLERLRFTAGLRFDAMSYDYNNHLSVETTGRYRRPASTRVDYTHLSPKLGATLEVGRGLNVFAAYAHGFRAPAEGQLFRQGRAENTVGLQPVKADNVEAGIRGAAGSVTFEASAYRLTKTDDILTLTNADGSTQTVNAGETLHRGIELALGAPLFAGLRFDANWSVAQHTYEEWQPTAAADYSGNGMEMAPQQIGNVALAWQPSFLAGASATLEWQRIGRYWMDADNTHRYAGHDLVNLRLAVPVMARTSLFARISNLGDERYAESSAYTTARGEEFAPGLPRAFYLGLQVR